MTVEATTLDELDAIPVVHGFVWRPIRRRFGIRAFGVNAYTSEGVGRQIVEEHDESRLGHRRVGRVIACWARRGLVANGQHARRRELLELSWRGHGAPVRATTRSGQLADAFVGHLVADELTRPAS